MNDTAIWVKARAGGYVLLPQEKLLNLPNGKRGFKWYSTDLMEFKEASGYPLKRFFKLKFVDNTWYMVLREKPLMTGLKKAAALAGLAIGLACVSLFCVWGVHFPMSTGLEWWRVAMSGLTFLGMVVLITAAIIVFLAEA